MTPLPSACVKTIPNIAKNVSRKSKVTTFSSTKKQTGSSSSKKPCFSQKKIEIKLFLNTEIKFS
jgi:hypothetical protein